MSDTPYREAWASLVNFTQGFAAPMLALLPILEQAKDAEAFITTLQPQIDEKQAELAAAEKAVEQAKADRQAVLDSIEHDRVVKQTDANQQLDAYRLKIQAAIDQLTADREQAQAHTSAELLTLAQQIEERTQIQRDLDAAIQQKRLVLADLTGAIQRASNALGT